MTQQIAIRLPEEQLAEIDRAVASGRFATRAAVVRAALDRLFGEERERRIEDAYRAGYCAKPQEVWVGEAGLAAFDAIGEPTDADL